MADLSPTTFDQYLQILDGEAHGRYLAIACLTLVLYDYFITLDEEVAFFWKGPWTVSRILFLLNRYFPPIIMILIVLGFTADLSSRPSYCTVAIQFLVCATLLSLFVIQAILAVRVWHLFLYNIFIRGVVVAAYIGSVSSTTVNLCKLLPLPQLRRPPNIIGRIPGCPLPAANVWSLLLPGFILHTILYLLTVYRAMKCKDSRATPMLKRLMRDGGLFYLVVVVCLGFATFGAFLTNTPTINIPATFSNYILAITSVSISRVMLSIHSLAANLRQDPNWLLNNIELSRVKWRTGRHDKELIVEVEAAEDEYPDYRGHDEFTTKDSVQTNPSGKDSELPIDTSGYYHR